VIHASYHAAIAQPQTTAGASIKESAGMETEIRNAEEEPLYVAAERVSPGIYQEVESLRRVLMKEEGVLPASFDGRVACYQRICPLLPASSPAESDCVLTAGRAER
jgi:hypothetical protein